MERLDIKKIRKELALSQTDFGKLLGVGLRSVQNWESGDRNISESAKKLLESIIKDGATLHKVPNNDSSTPATNHSLEEIIIERVLKRINDKSYPDDILERLDDQQQTLKDTQQDLLNIFRMVTELKREVQDSKPHRLRNES